MVRHDILIIGAGLAGLRAAIELGPRCAVVCKTYPNLAHSSQAQGGINAAIDIHDNWKDHVYDTVYGGDFLNDQDAVEILCKNAPRVINELQEYGVTFSKTKNGKVAQRAFGGQHFNRTCYAADRTGHALLHSVYETALKKGTKFYNEYLAITITKVNGQVNGVICIDLASGKYVPIEAKAVIVATGGAGRVYGKTTNPENTGDGISIAHSAGAALMDMEMIQFHPTTLRGSNKLLSEAARGEGAFLLNSKNERFMKKYAPDKMELASRDVVTRAEAIEIRNGRGILGDSVYLDFRHLQPEVISTKIPDIKRNALELVGIDITKEPVPVQPAQHYTMGGIMTDNSGKTNVSGLFAAGECACVSVHGANRLGGNSLLETLVFGKRAALSALEYSKKTKFVALKQDLTDLEQKKVDKWMKNKNGFSPREIKIKIGKIMDELVGPFRSGTGLLKAKKLIQKIKKQGIYLSEKSEIFNMELISVYETEFILDLAECITQSALIRTESRGAHTRTDYPKRDDEKWLKHICLVNGKISYRKIMAGKIKPVERHY